MRFPAIGLGCASLGRPQVSEDEAVGTMLAALEAGIGHLDTASLYGCGLSERRVGRALRAAGAGAIVSTKVGYVIDVPEGSYLPAEHRRHDFSRRAVRDSLFRSLERLGLDRVELVSLHDPVNRIEHAEEGFHALDELRGEGLLGGIGVGTNSVETAVALLRRCPLDAVLIAGRLTLLDRSAGRELLPLCAERGVHVIVGGVFNSGLLAAPDAPGATFDYAPAAAPLVDRARALARLAERHRTSLRAAALQFPARQAGVGTRLIGPSSRSELADALAGLDRPVPEGFWQDHARMEARHAP